MTTQILSLLRRRSRLVPAAFSLFGVLLGGPLLAQELDPSALQPYTERIPTGFINWGEGYAEVVVDAVYDTQRFGGSHAKIRAIEDAEEKADPAFYRLLRGINVDGSTRIAGNAALEDALRKMIPKRRSMTDRKTANMTMRTTFRLRLYGKRALAETIRAVALSDAQPGALSGTSGGSFTSVVFDASGTSLQTALFPRVLDEAGEVLYGPGDLSAKARIQAAPVTYLVRSGAQVKRSGFTKKLAKDLGAHPLVLKVSKISGDFLADIVLRGGQEKRLAEAGVGDLLAAGKVYVLQTASADWTQK
ncbi:MAG: hypothetical protein ACE5HD_03250 [Acidobacteriota bacterium]